MSYGVALRNGVPFTLGTIAALCVNATASWSPADMPSLGAWYDPSDLSTMFQDAAGTTPVTAAGQPVGLILDKSGNGYHASQSTSTARPVLEDDGGKMCLKFDGVDDYLSTSAIDLTGTSTITLFTGAKVTSGGVAVFLETSTNGIAGGAFYVTSNDNAANIGTFAASGNAGAVNYTTTGQPAHAVTSAQLTSVFTGGVGAATVRVNSAPQSMAVSYNGGNSSGNFGNHPLYIGARGTPAYFWNGNLYSLIIGGAAYDAATVLAAETWVADKTGVTL